MEKIIDKEEKRRKQNADYFNQYARIYNEALDEEKERKKLGFSTPFEFAVYELLVSTNKDQKQSKSTTELVFEKVGKSPSS